MKQEEEELFRNGFALAQDYLDHGYERDENGEPVISLDALGDLFDIAALTVPGVRGLGVRE
jgi:hypothetical protein